MFSAKLASLPATDWNAAFGRFRRAENHFYRFLYIVGIQSVRILKRARRRLSRFFHPFSALCSHVYVVVIGRRLLWLKKELGSIRNGFSVAARRLSEAKIQGPAEVCAEGLRIAGISLRLHKSFLCSVLNIAVPAVSVLVLLLTVQHWQTLNYGLILESNGEKIAVIQDESIYEQATEMVNERMVHDTAEDEARPDYEPVFRLSVVNHSYADASYVCDRLIKQSNGIIEEASGLYVDGELFGVVKSGADLRYLLRNRLDSVRGKDEKITAQFVQNVEIINGLFPTTALISSEKMNGIIKGTSKAGVSYTVKDGDTVTSIAKANHMTVASLNKINGNQLGDSIHPGDLISLEVAVPNLSVELVKTETRRVSVPYKTTTQNDDAQYTDYSKVLTEGHDGIQECVDKIYLVNGTETKRETVSQKMISEAVDKVVLTGTKKRPKTGSGVSSGSLMWPVPSLRTITTYFTWRWGSFHYGIDISGSGAYGKTIVAADGGVVTSAGWDGGYGNRVVIRHNGSISTLYGHCSKLLVTPGQRVSKGQAVARVGSTGNSTGAHCHFEVIQNGRKVNPLGYLNR